MTGFEENVMLEYIRGQESYANLARRLGVSPGALARRGRKEEWPRLRREYRIGLAAEVSDDCGAVGADGGGAVGADSISARAYGGSAGNPNTGGTGDPSPTGAVENNDAVGAGAGRKPVGADAHIGPGEGEAERPNLSPSLPGGQTAPSSEGAFGRGSDDRDAAGAQNNTAVGADSISPRAYGGSTDNPDKGGTVWAPSPTDAAQNTAASHASQNNAAAAHHDAPNADRDAAGMARVEAVAGMLLGHMEALLSRPEVDSQTVQRLASALKTVKDTCGLRSDAEAREQEAKIKGLILKNRAEGEVDNTITVVLGDAAKYAL